MLPGVISRSIVSCFLALVAASLFHSGLTALVIHILTASEFALVALMVHLICNSFGPKSTFGKIYPHLLKVHNSIAIITESAGFILFCGIVFKGSRARPKGQKFNINRDIDHIILSYFTKLAWYIAFALSMWCKSTFMTACFGIPLGAVCSITILSLLHAFPSLPVLELLLTGFRDSSGENLPMARVVTTRDIATESSHDGVLEIRHMERLNRLFPSEEESCSYQRGPDVSASNLPKIGDIASKAQPEA
ncbi:hypothetical protein DL93DRAFT_511342 [Clavulina sp. PMI_390]|nr:hypothetical protein DL93DRAFT_511342 [Clavulina sp. PMI_390]